MRELVARSDDEAVKGVLVVELVAVPAEVKCDLGWLRVGRRDVDGDGIDVQAQVLGRAKDRGRELLLEPALDFEVGGL